MHRSSKVLPSRRSLKIRTGSTAGLLALAALVGMNSTVITAQITPAQPRISEHKSLATQHSMHPPEAGQETFSSATEAATALVAALEKDDQPSLLRVLGSSSKDIILSGDEVQDKTYREQFLQKYRQMNRLVTESDGTTTLYIGAENWPTPIPLVHQGNSWYFETEAGRHEILYRRVGENELTVIQVCLELVDAQKEYYSKPHDGSSGSEYAQKILSDPEKHNGLYWKTTSGETESPLGPLLASAEREGYSDQENQKAQLFHGYYFRVLRDHGRSSSSTAQSYIVDSKMTRGFTFLAYPAEYRASGVMTFLVDQSGIVYEKDLGPGTATITKTLNRYTHDPTWRKAD
jgi:DUF2950 family protein